MIEEELTASGHFAPQSGGHGLHVAIIMDGNGRWAQNRGLPRSTGHAAGAHAVERVVEAALKLPIERLTLFALSADNWSRPAGEIAAILELMRVWLAHKTDECVAKGIRLSVIGRRDRLPDTLVAAIEHAEFATATPGRLHLRLAVDYSARDAIVRAARRFNVQSALDGARDGFERMLAQACHAGDVPRDVDLLVRTGGEQRLSDFLLWECAYAELIFSTRSWPEFTAEDLVSALREFSRRDRRFGGCTPQDAE